MDDFILTVDNVYDYLLTNTPDFQSLSEDDRRKRASETWESFKKLYESVTDGSFILREFM